MLVFTRYLCFYLLDLFRYIFRFRCCCRRKNKNPPSQAAPSSKPQPPITPPLISRVVQVKEYNESQMAPDEKRYFFFHSSPTPVHRPLRDETLKKQQVVNFENEVNTHHFCTLQEDSLQFASGLIL